MSTHRKKLKMWCYCSISLVYYWGEESKQIVRYQLSLVSWKVTRTFNSCSSKKFDFSKTIKSSKEKAFCCTRAFFQRQSKVFAWNWLIKRKWTRVSSDRACCLHLNYIKCIVIIWYAHVPFFCSTWVSSIICDDIARNNNISRKRDLPSVARRGASRFKKFSWRFKSIFRFRMFATKIKGRSTIFIIIFIKVFYKRGHS